MSIDVHAHCIPQVLLDVMRADGADFGVTVDEDNRPVIAGKPAQLPMRNDLTDFDARIKSMDQAGIEQQILASWVNLTGYGLDADKGARWSRRINEALAAEAERRPDRFLAMATVPLQHPAAAAAELRHAVHEMGMVGVEIATTVDGTDLVAAELEPFWSAAAETRALVLLHPMDPLPGIDLRKHFLHNAIGRPAETTIAIARVVMAGVLDRHPDLRICVVHGGGFLPYQIGRLQRAWEVKPQIAAVDLTTPPVETLRQLYFDTIVHEPAVLRFLIDLVGAEQILLGTDYPFEAGDLDPLRTLDKVPRLTDTERALIASENAARLLAELGEAT